MGHYLSNLSHNGFQLFYDLFQTDSVMLTLAKIHAVIETLDKHFGSVCELDLVFQFHKAQALLDDLLGGGYLIQTDASLVSRTNNTIDALTDSCIDGSDGGPKLASL